MKKDFKFREIPYNYTSFSDREIILKYFDEETWDILQTLRSQRVTGRSAKLLFEVMGDIFIIERNPYIYNDFLENPKKIKRMMRLHDIRMSTIEEGSKDNQLVLQLIEKTRKINGEFINSFSRQKQNRKKILNALKGITSKNNIHFSAFHKVSHATDASDWRVEYPAVVVYPDSADEIPGLIEAAKKLSLSIIPRGGGTGLTGGAVPLYQSTMVINTEKLNGIGEIEMISDGGMHIPVVSVDAGAITEEVINYCAARGYIFATDPTSAWASTIGGNIAENAGGKKCVMWGTAIDNLYSYRIINAAGEILEVKRRSHPHRKILPGDDVVFDITRNLGSTSEQKDSVTLKGTDIRKPGLGKDITNKALNGLPGLQKEGGDGIIISAVFVLYRPFTFCKTVCLEFFGSNLINASRAIVDIKNTFEEDAYVFLTALEHWDEKYVEAINYRNKSQRTDIPKAVLLIDLESNAREKLDNAARTIITMVQVYNTEAIIAANDSERMLFWKDRKNLGAIAKHTNAFKLNEDIVIPLEKLPEFADFIEKLNLEKELANNISIIDQLTDYISGIRLRQKEEYSNLRFDSFLDHLDKQREIFHTYAAHLDSPASSVQAGKNGVDTGMTVFMMIQEGRLGFSFDEIVMDPLNKVLRGYEDLLEKCNEIIREEKKRKIIIATHMHAGDGNVHVNIPVNSNDYEMMQEADETAGVVMRRTVEMGGVISGEHGIGLTKLRFIEQDVLDDYARYKNTSDPDDIFNPGKLSGNFPLTRIYTPSFNLLELEAFILKATDLENLSVSIASCVRCGKCKSVCNTHYPGGTMFYNSRNKILGVGLITEAVLYDAQTSNSLSFRNFKKLQEISDHCTVCHKCQVPCPVNIDLGDITMKIRELMVHRRKSKFKLITWVTLLYLKRKGYYINKFFRIGLLNLGYGAQRVGYWFNRPISKLTDALVPRISGFLKGKLPRAGGISVRESFGLKGSNCFYCFQNPDITLNKSVFYFPGCGSERMFPQISMATLALLYNAGIRVVIPPEFLCCGYPLLANGRNEEADVKSYENRVILHRIADMTGYMDIGNVIISCGTCYEMLEKYQISTIFKKAMLMDVNEFIAAEKLFSPVKVEDCSFLYHDPCHSPLKHMGYEETFKSLFNSVPELVPYCCGESGTMALSTPEISNMLRNRKMDSIKTMVDDKRVTVVSTCPSCIQGLSRCNGDMSVAGKSLVEFTAEKVLGKNWEKVFVRKVRKDGIEKIIF